MTDAEKVLFYKIDQLTKRVDKLMRKIESLEQKNIKTEWDYVKHPGLAQAGLPNPDHTLS